MANNTDTGIAPLGDGELSSEQAASDLDSHRPGGPPFGDPDQHLYGGGWHGSPPPNAPAAPAESPYEGRHRAAD